MATPEEIADEMISRHAQKMQGGQFDWRDLKREIINAINTGAPMRREMAEKANPTLGAEAFDHDHDGNVGGSAVKAEPKPAERMFGAGDNMASPQQIKPQPAPVNRSPSTSPEKPAETASASAPAKTKRK